MLVFFGAFWFLGNAASPSGTTAADGDEPGTGAGPGPVTGEAFPRESPAERHYLYERPGWDDMVEHVRGMWEHYRDLWDSGELAHHAPDGVTPDPVYAQAFFRILTDRDHANRFLGSAGTDPEELDAVIEGRRAWVDELERRFLAGEPLGVEVRIVRDDGSEFYSDGTYAGGAPTGAHHPTRRADPEELAREFVPQLDGQGTFRTSAAELAALFGVRIDYRFDGIYTHCTGGGTDPRFVIAAVCTNTPDRIYVNEGHGNYPDSVDDLYWFDTIRHELAHLQILERCGTTRPPIVGATHYEAVTNSYAVLFLGMDRGLVQQTNDGFPEYHTSPESDAAARSIHGGDCG